MFIKLQSEVEKSVNVDAQPNDWGMCKSMPLPSTILDCWSASFFYNCWNAMVSTELVWCWLFVASIPTTWPHNASQNAFLMKIIKAKHGNIFSGNQF